MNICTLRALVHLAELRQAIGDHQRALAALEQAISADPVAEELYRRRIRLQAELDRPDAVRRTYRLLARRLADLDVDPEPETKQLVADLLRRPGAWARGQHLSTGHPPCSPGLRHGTCVKRGRPRPKSKTTDTIWISPAKGELVGRRDLMWWLAIAGVALTATGVIIALLAWLFPFDSGDRSLRPQPRSTAAPPTPTPPASSYPRELWSEVDLDRLG
ncbi:MAG TPA: bacterial transcriptional activator domain-containing protein, partial [Actinomycetes bacterium]|nr:bacterial transcriptional activator domain-containing protein [Actinomycetes bacterium]